jgi:thioredoxin-like negative regulator of GroEL
MSGEATSLNRWWRWIVVPMGLGLGILLGLLWLRSPAPTSQELFEQYFSPHHLPVLFPDGGGVRNWTEAARSYQAGDYEKARQALLRAREAEELPASAIQFYIGQCLLATGKSEEALVVFYEARQVQESPHEAIRWYMAMAYLQLGQTAPAKDLLWEIENDKGYKSGTATQLLQEF